MNRYPIMILAMLTALVSVAAPNSTITNSIPGYQYIAATNTDVGTTGVATGTSYVCIPEAALVYLSAADASESAGDVRALEFALVKYFYDQRYAITSTNQTQQLKISETSVHSSETNSTIEFKHQVRTQIFINGDSVTIPVE